MGFIYLAFASSLGFIFFLISILSILFEDGREYIKSSLEGTNNYLTEIISDIENGSPKIVIVWKYIFHVVLSAILGCFIGILWPLPLMFFFVSIVSYLKDK